MPAGRRRVIETAAALADRDGFEAVTTTTLAAELGVRPPSLYKHIRSLDELRGEIQAHAIDALAEALTAAAVGRAGEDAVHAVARAWRAFALRHPGLQDALSRQWAMRADGVVEPGIAAADARVLSVGMRLLEPFKLGRRRSVHALRMLRALISGFTLIERQGGFQLDVEAEDSFTWMIERYLRSLKKGGKDARD